MDNSIAVIFDMDGVIIDSNPIIIETWTQFFKRYNIILNEKQFAEYVFGRTAEDTLNLVFKKGLPLHTLSQYIDEVHRSVKSLYKEKGAITPGFKNMVKLLVNEGIAIGIATSAPGENVDVVLAKSETTEFFQFITDAGQVEQSKPHPEVYLKTALKLNVQPSNCCVFEDSFSGIQSARAAGMKVIGVSTTHSKNELKHCTDLVIENFEEISIAQIRAIIEGV